MNSKVLIVKQNDDNIFFKYIENKPIAKLYKVSQKNIIFRICRKLNLCILIFFLGSWKNKIDRYEKVILFDDGFSDKISKYIKKKNKCIKIILWFWNPIDSSNIHKIYDKNVDEIWTYNMDDAKKYNLKYNSQFYTNKINLKNEIINDVVFLGAAKNRKNQIIDFEKQLQSKNIKTNFKIVENKKDYLSYDQYLALISKSQCIFDYNYPIISGCTLRVMEALFFEKKLITNNKNIINYDFYDKNNIFVIGIDNIDEIELFIKSPYKKINNKIIDYYDFESWIKRF